MVEKMVMKLVTQMEERKIIEKSNSDYYEYVLLVLTDTLVYTNSNFFDFFSLIEKTNRRLSCR